MRENLEITVTIGYNPISVTDKNNEYLSPCGETTGSRYPLFAG